MRLLVVDDDQVFREEFVTFLSDEGHQAASAPSVRKALELLDTEEVDAVFTDLKMPRQSGLELLKELRRRRPNTYVVLVTGFATVETAVEAMKGGAFDYIEKPFRAERVREVLGLISDEMKFARPSLPSVKAAELARELAQGGKVPILFATATTPPPAPGVEVFAFDGQEPSALVHALDGFLTASGRGGLVLDRVDRMLDRHRLDDVVSIIEQLRERLRNVGPFAVGLDPKRVSQVQADALRAAVTAPAVQSALDALSNPIRRRLLQRLASGPAGFSEAMHAVGLNDSPKMAFHIHRLVEEQYIARNGETYLITPKGERAVELLAEVEQSAAGVGRRLFVSPGPAR